MNLRLDMARICCARGPLNWLNVLSNVYKNSFFEAITVLFLRISCAEILQGTDAFQL